MSSSAPPQATYNQESKTIKYKPVTKACTSCRQSKVKCNIAETFPSPCERCRRLKKECRSDPTFKRTRVRGRLEEVTKQLDRIQRAQSQQQDELSRSASEAPCSELVLPNQTPIPSEQPDSNQVFGLHQIDSQCSQVSMRELDSIQISSFDIVELFKYFSSHHLRIYPILDTRMTINNLHQKNSLLFWTIIVIASRDHPILNHYFASLSPPFKRLLSETLAGPMRSVYTIHSLLLYCLWPLPVQKQILDPSWNYIGIAVSAALRMGLHSNHAPWEYGLQKFSVEDIQLRRRTWLTCFMVSTYLSADLGLPSPMTVGSDFNIILQDWLSHNSTDVLALHVEIQHHVARFASILSQQNDSLIRSPLILMFDHELEALGARVAKAEGQQTQIIHLGARLKLYSFSLLFESRNANIPGQNYVDSSRKTIWYLGLETAVRIAYICSSTCDEPISSSQKHHLFYPKHIFFLLINAGLYLLKFLFVNDDATSSEKDLARDHIRLVHSCLLKWTRNERDECDRIARVISLLANAEAQGKLREICKDTRPGATLLADGMRMVIWSRAQDKELGVQQIQTSPAAKFSASNNGAQAVGTPKFGAVEDSSGNGMGTGNGEIILQQLGFEQEDELALTTMRDFLMPDDLWDMDAWFTEDLFSAPPTDSFNEMTQ